MKYLVAPQSSIAYSAIRISFLVCLICIPLAGMAGDILFPPFPDNVAMWAAVNPLAKIKQGEFEKTADYNKRACVSIYEVLHTNEKKLAYFLTASSGKNGVAINYDVDKETFAVDFGGAVLDSPDARLGDRWRWGSSGWTPRGLNGNGYDNVELASRFDVLTETYPGQNAFGVSKNVRLFAQREFVLFFRPERDWKRKIQLRAKPDEARKLKGDLRLVVAARIVAPCVISGMKHTSPTVNYAYEGISEAAGIVGNDAEWLIVRGSTMEVLKRGYFNREGSPQSALPAATSDIRADASQKMIPQKSMDMLKVFAVELGVFSVAENVESVSRKMTAANIPIYRESIAIGNGSAVRIRVGPYETAAEANTALKQVRKLGISGKIVLQH
jgi:hypothetical protein